MATTYDMAVVNAAQDALMGMSKLAAVPKRKIQFVNYKDAVMDNTCTYHTMEFGLAYRANVALMDIPQNDNVTERRILFVSAIVVLVTTYEMAIVNAAKDAIRDGS